MATYTYTFAVDDRELGSKLSNRGWSTDDPEIERARPKPLVPTIHSGDRLQVCVLWPGRPTEPGRPQEAPDELAGHFMISAAPGMTDQLMPSPFRNGANYLCYKKQTTRFSEQGGGLGYLFTGLVVASGGGAQYELTFTLECEELGFYHDRQWSIDPEFDTGN